jgi:NADPH:quinone reductase-like Zn-dependent oxidoreductase
VRAVGFSVVGGPEVLGVVDVPEPTPGPGEVRIRVAAAAVNPTDTMLRAGDRIAAMEPFGPPWIPGMDLAGQIDAVGDGTTWQVGDRVMAIVLPLRPGGGAQAERVVVPAASVAAVPAGCTLTEASTLPMNGLTARLALDLLDLSPGQTLAVTGAAGAVGGYVVEIAAAEGIRVIADASSADEALVRGFGAEYVVRRGPDVAAAIRDVVPEGVDAVVDGSLQQATLLPALRDGGGLAAVRAFEGETERGITVHQVSVASYATNHAALDGLRQLVEDGVVSLRVAETFTADHAGEAHAKLAAGGVRGRLVIVF